MKAKRAAALKRLRKTAERIRAANRTEGFSANEVRVGDCLGTTQITGLQRLALRHQTSVREELALAVDAYLLGLSFEEAQMLVGLQGRLEATARRLNKEKIFRRSPPDFGLSRERLVATAVEQLFSMQEFAEQSKSSAQQRWENDLHALRLSIVCATRWLTAAEIAKANGQRTKELVTQWKQRRKLFAVPILRLEGDEEDRYAAYQFDNHMKPRPVIAEVLRIFGKKKNDPWKILFWFHSVNGWLGGQAPYKCLDEPELVIKAAKHEMETIEG